MTSTPQNDRFLDALTANVGDESHPWLAELRREAATELREHGLPTHEHESWRFTSPKPLSTASWIAPTKERPRYHVASDAGAGVEVRSVSDVLASEPGLIQQHLGRVAPSEHFAALNTLLFRDGIVVRIKAGAKPTRPIQILHASASIRDPAASYGRVLVVCEPLSEATFVERFLATDERPHLSNVVTEVVLAEGAALEHVRLLDASDSAMHVGMLGIRQDRDSRYSSCVVTLGGALSRIDLRLILDGEGAECALDGAYVATNKTHIDHHTWIEHVAPHCSSRESYWGILDGVARAVFDGTIVVRKDARGTSAHQENRNLLLSNDAVVNTKPHLRIDTDDVKCSHGATVGSLDERQLFYLRSRGVDTETARAMLTYAFVRNVVARATDEGVRSMLESSVRKRLPMGDVLEGFA